jgi:hypothetical protein
LILDGSNTTYHTDTYFKASGIKAYSLTSGDTIGFSSMNITSTKSLITDPYHSIAYDSRDIFYKDEAFKVMERLVDCEDSYALGKSKEKNPRFELKFSKNESTKGYWSDYKYTVDNVTLDIYHY